MVLRRKGHGVTLKVLPLLGQFPTEQQKGVAATRKEKLGASLNHELLLSS